MRVLIVIPRQPAATGNRVTAERQKRGLAALGHKVALVEVEVGQTRVLAVALAAFRPDAALLLHAWRSGEPWLQVKKSAAIPCVVCLTGTDLHEDLVAPERAPIVQTVLARAAAIVTQNPFTTTDLRRAGAEWTERLHYLPPAVVLGDEPYPLREILGVDAETLVLLHPAGIRPVKGNRELLTLLGPVAKAYDNFVVAFCGPDLDPDYAAEFHTALRSRPWARALGVIPHAAMAAALRAADLVLNNSASEGLPNALLEAAVLGRPMLVRNIPGNAAVVSDDVNGHLYDDAATFRRHLGALLDDPALRRRLAVPDPERYRPEHEAHELESLLRTVCDKKHTGLVPGPA
ncbi:MAG: hypothetical protein A2005_08145 [Desulfuromonadales bacterium GWC2_61_20]|nr:MAG: hypothetical protein A2005_08145 [Desulfuromonadales bacterium GWC2_61_20]HBT83115.1 hypothetical protein [Desulfuromonas sp.]